MACKVYHFACISHATNGSVAIKVGSDANMVDAHDLDGDGGVPGMANSSELINFTIELLRRRYSEEDIAKIWGGNWLRVMRQAQDAKVK